MIALVSRALPGAVAIALLGAALSGCSAAGSLVAPPVGAAQAAANAAAGAHPTARPISAAPVGPLEPPAVRAPSAILIDLATGKVLFAHRPDRHLPVASLTKIMTALLVLERDPSLRGSVLISRRAARQAPIKIGLKAGSKLPVSDLMYGLLLWSGNDTAVALAEHMSGSVSKFVRRMNERAAALGLRDTHFTGPSGLDDHGYSTARDMAELARVALANQRFASFVRTRRHKIHGPKHQLHKLENLNALLATYPGAIGVKTGYTSAAGECVVGAAQRDEHSVLAVVLGEKVVPHWRIAYGDTKRLLWYGFQRLAAAPAPAPAG